MTTLTLSTPTYVGLPSLMLEPGQNTVFGGRAHAGRTHANRTHGKVFEKLHWLTLSDDPRAQALRFSAIGVASTMLNWLVYLSSRPFMSVAWANLLAIVISTFASTSANRIWNFRSTETNGATGAWRDHLMSFTAFGLGWLLAIMISGQLEAYFGELDTVVELVIVQGCSILGSAVRFGIMRHWSK